MSESMFGMPTTIAIINPTAGRGRALAAWRRWQSRHLQSGAVEIRTTERPGHAIEIVRGCLRAGARTIIAVGGDGTVNEVVNGFFENGRALAPDAVLRIVPCGTASDFHRTLVRRGDDIVAADVLHVRYTDFDGGMLARYALNIVSCGMGGAVAGRASHLKGRLSGRAAFLAATLYTAAGFRGRRVRLILDDRELTAGITNVAAGNGQFHGGGMWVCPEAVLDDGLMDVTVIEYVSLWRIVRDLPWLYNGRIHSHPRVRHFRVARLRMESSEPTLIEIDGEPAGRLPVDIEVLPQAIRIAVSPTLD